MKLHLNMTHNLGKGLIATALGAALLVSGCGGSGAKGGDKAAGGGKAQSLTIGATNSPKTLNPVAATDITSEFFARMGFDSLLGQPEPYKFTNHLASSFDTKDKQTYTIKINPKAKWSDGKPVTADDVVFSFNLVANPKTETSWTKSIKFLKGVNDKGRLPEGAKTVAGVVKKDDTTVEIICKQPTDPNYVKDKIGFNFLIYPKHIYEKIEPGKISASAEGKKPTVFSGPYKLVKYVTNDHAEFTANDQYVQGTPKIKNLFIKIQNGTNLVVDLKAGKIQMSAGGIIGKIQIKDVDMLKKEKNLSVKSTPSLSTQLMEINNMNPAFNKHFRLALAHAINRKQIVDQLYQGHAYVNPTLYTKVSPAFDATVQNPKYDVELAKKELAESGFDTSKELTLLVPIGNVPREQSAEIIQQNLQAIGLKLKLQKMDFPTMMSRGQKGDYDFQLMGLPLQADPDYYRYYEPGSLTNFSHVDDARLNETFEAAAKEVDSQKRIEEYKAIQKYLAENQFNIALYGEEDFIIQAKNLVGGMKPYWNGSLDDIHTWYFK